MDRLAWSGSSSTTAGTSTTSTSWTLTDHQDSVRDIVSGNASDRGKLVEHRQYDSFGRMVRQTTGPLNTAAATSGVGVEFGYAGRPLEARSGLSDNRARWYEPGTGRFINEDPSGFKGGDANLFRYVGNDPLDQVDPSGLTGRWAQSKGSVNIPQAAWAGFGQTSLGTSLLQGPVIPMSSGLGTSAQTFTGKTNNGIPFGEFLVSRGGGATKPAAAHQIAPGFGVRDAVSIGVGILPITGIAQSGIELATGYDYIANRPASRVFAAVGIAAALIPGGKPALKGLTRTLGAAARSADDVVDGARFVRRVDDAASAGNNAIAVVSVIAPAKFDVGPYNKMKGLVPGLDAHHAGQAAVMKKLVAGYDYDTAPAILVPKVGHTIRGPNGIVSRSTNGLDAARDALARDINELRRVYPDVPNAGLKELVDMNKRMYPEMAK